MVGNVVLEREFIFLGREGVSEGSEGRSDGVGDWGKV